MRASFSDLSAPVQGLAFGARSATRARQSPLIAPRPPAPRLLNTSVIRFGDNVGTKARSRSGASDDYSKDDVLEAETAHRPDSGFHTDPADFEGMRPRRPHRRRVPGTCWSPTCAPASRTERLDTLAPRVRARTDPAPCPPACSTKGLPPTPSAFCPTTWSATASTVRPDPLREGDIANMRRHRDHPTAWHGDTCGGMVRRRPRSRRRRGGWWTSPTRAWRGGWAQGVSRARGSADVGPQRIQDYVEAAALAAWCATSAATRRRPRCSTTRRTCCTTAKRGNAGRSCGRACSFTGRADGENWAKIPGEAAERRLGRRLTRDKSLSRPSASTRFGVTENPASRSSRRRRRGCSSRRCSGL